MSRDVASVTPETHVIEAAAMLLRHGIRAMPVLDVHGHLVGVVSETDLMRRVELGTDSAHPWWRRLFRNATTAASDYVKTHGRRVRHVMNPRAVTTTADTPLQEVVRMLAEERCGWLPVISDDRVVGGVSRTDVVTALARLRMSEKAEPRRDESVRQEVQERIRGLSFGHPFTHVTVQAGEVSLWGLVWSPAERLALCIAAENTPGVRSVHDNLVRASHTAT